MIIIHAYEDFENIKQESSLAHSLQITEYWLSFSQRVEIVVILITMSQNLINRNLEGLP